LAAVVALAVTSAMTTSAAATQRARGDDHGVRPNAVQYDPRETVGKNQPSAEARKLASTAHGDVTAAAARANALTPRNLPVGAGADGNEADLSVIRPRSIASVFPRHDPDRRHHAHPATFEASRNTLAA
jgi:hypothetical protein